MQEYNELTSKLHEFKALEQDVIERLAASRNGRSGSPSDQDDGDHALTDSSDLLSSSSHLRPGEVQAPGPPPAPPRSPLKSVVRAYLPNEQRTTVQVKPGQTVREALSKAMKLRKLDPSICSVYRCSQPETKVGWEADILSVEGEEIRVELKENLSVHTSISHNFVRKTFFSLAYCESCRRLLFQGFYCRTCGYRFHQRCAAAVPPLCNPAHVEENTFLQM